MRDLFGPTRQLQQQLEALWHKLYRVAYAWTHDRHLAADLAQETVSRALRQREKFTDEHHLQRWLFRVMANCWRDSFRRRRITADINDDTLIDPGQQPDEHSAQQQIVQRVRRAVATLNFDQRQVITLVVLEGCSYEEAATILAIPVGTVMSRVSRARQQLQTTLQDLRDMDTTKHVWRIK
jgi:RNA polymerase sigma-70 factor, ECF subfamily